MSTNQPSKTSRLLDVELHLFHDYNGDGTKQDDDPSINDIIIDVSDKYGNKILESIEVEKNGKYLLYNLEEGKEYLINFHKERIRDFRFFSLHNGAFAATNAGYNFFVDPNQTIISIGLMVGPLTLPIRKGTKWHFEAASFFDLDPKNKIQDWKGEAQSYQGHTGTDFFMNEGEPVLAAAPGYVIDVRKSWSKSDPYSRYAGKRIAISHGYGIETTYLHLKDILVSQGQKVARGERIGLCDHTGLMFVAPNKDLPMPKKWSHLHLELRPSGFGTHPLDPYRNINNPNHIHSELQPSGFGTHPFDPYRDINNPNSLCYWTKDNDPQYPIIEE